MFAADAGSETEDSPSWHSPGTTPPWPAPWQALYYTVLGDKPSTFHELVAVGSLWSRESGSYSHAALAHQLGKSFVHTSLSLLHNKLFTDWLSIPIGFQKLEFEQFLRDPGMEFNLSEPTANSFRNCVPTVAAPAERLLFEGDLNVILLMLRADSRESGPRVFFPAAGHGLVEAVVQRVKAGGNNATLHLGDLSAELDVSPNHLGRLFHCQTGVTFARYQLAVRMFRAANLLLTTRSTIAEVASRLGYGDAANFRRDFQRAIGKSPARYRREKACAMGYYGLPPGHRSNIDRECNKIDRLSDQSL